MRVRLALLGLLALAAWPAAAQSDPDPIGVLLNQSSQIPDEPDTAGQTVQPPPPEPVILTPRGAPQSAAPARPQLTKPVNIEEAGKTPDAPPTLKDLAYDSRIKSSFASAQGYQGPLDGGWVLSSGGVDLYALQLVDRTDRLEGAWRDLRRIGALSASGLVDDITRAGDELTVRFAPAPGAAVNVAVLHGGADGRWSGELTQGAERRSVTLRRAGP